MSRDLSVAVAVARRLIHNLVRNPALLIPSLIFPVFFFTAFAGGLSAVGNAPGFDFAGGYTAFQFVFVLLQSAAFGGVFTGFTLAADFESGFTRRLMLAAPRRWAIIAGYGIAALFRSILTMTLLTVIALVVGMKVGGSTVDLFGLYGLAVLVNISATLFGTGVAATLRTIQAGPLMQIPVFLILFMAPVYVPYALLSGWIKAVASINPVTALLDTGRGFISGDPTSVALAFGIMVAALLLLGVFASRGMRSAERAGA